MGKVDLICCLLILAAVFGLVLGGTIFQWCTSDVVTVRVVKSERIITGNSSKYLVFTDGEVFENVDSWAFLKLNSSDIYCKMRPGEKYKLRVCGWRWPCMSWYRNIISISTE